MKKALHGMYWSYDLDLAPPRKVHSLREGLFVFRKNSPDIIWNTLGTFENNPCTLAQAETILQGLSVEGLSLLDLDQVRHFGLACRDLQTLLEQESFSLSKECLCRLHALVGKEEALEWGVFRQSNVSLRHVEYTPPDSSELPAALRFLAEQA